LWWETATDGPERAPEVFGKPTESASPAIDLQALHAKIGQLALENDFFRGRAQLGWIADRKAMIDRHAKLSISRQADLLNISRVVSITCLGPSREVDWKS